MASQSLSLSTARPIEAAQDVYLVRTLISNVVLVAAGAHASAGWVLIDAGMPGYTRRILGAAEHAFGGSAQLQSIILTHGHFDHVGCLPALLRASSAPLYAHAREIPHLTGRRDYPPADPLAGGGLMAWSSPLYPRRAIDVGARVQPLPADGSIPGLPGWWWLHTPGHTAGHVSLFRPDDRVLIAGDAVITTKQESALAVLTQHRLVRRPPAYFTPDWDHARDSVRRLEALAPEVLVTGHGLPMRGSHMRMQLGHLAARFDRVARPTRGRYATQEMARWRQPRPLSRSGSTLAPETSNSRP